MSELPHGWVTAPISSIIELATGKLDANAATENGPYPFFTCGREVLRIDRFAFDQQAVLLAGNGDFNVKRYEGKFNAYQRTYVLRPIVIPNDFLYYLVSHHLPTITGNERGSTIQYIRKGDIEYTTVAVPPLAEQRRIVAKIDSLTSKSRRARDHLDHIPRLVEKYKQAVLAMAFSPNVTGDWRQATLEDVVVDALIGLVRGKSDQSETSGVPYIRMNHYDLDGRWNVEGLTLVDADAKELARYELREGDVLFNTRNSFELVGKVALWSQRPSGCVYNNNLLRLRLNPEVVPAFAFYQMISPQFRTYLHSVKSATTSVCAIYQRSIMAAPFAYPERDRQLEIVTWVANALARIDRLASNATSVRKLIDGLDQAVLTKAFRGELVPQDPTDEPADLLLERIRAKRAGASKPKRGRKSAAHA